MRHFSTLCLLAMCGGLVAADDKKAGDEKTSSTVRVTSLILRKAPPAKPGEFTFTPNGTTMELQVSQPGKFIVGIDAKASKLESFTDDKNNNLNKRPAAIFGGAASWITEYMTQISPDGERCTIQITAPGAPGKGAEKILAKGSLIVKCGAGEKTTEAKELAVKMNEEVMVGAFAVKVNQAGQFGAQITVQSDEPNVKSAQFLDGKGKAIMTLPPGRGTQPVAPGGKSRHVLSYFVNSKVDKVSVKVTYFDKVESATVPLNVRVGLDLE